VKYPDAVTRDKEFTVLFTSYEAKPTTLVYYLLSLALWGPHTAEEAKAPAEESAALTEGTAPSEA
jgi:hypothetical protein